MLLHPPSGVASASSGEPPVASPSGPAFLDRASFTVGGSCETGAEKLRSAVKSLVGLYNRKMPDPLVVAGTIVHEKLPDIGFAELLSRAPSYLEGKYRHSGGKVLGPKQFSSAVFFLSQQVGYLGIIGSPFQLAPPRSKLANT